MPFSWKLAIFLVSSAPSSSSPIVFDGLGPEEPKRSPYVSGDPSAVTDAYAQGRHGWLISFCHETREVSVCLSMSLLLEIIPQSK